MTEKWEDYYKILQVHFMAEPEIIKAAYIRLSKKYHPDVSDSILAQDKMQQINRAYEVLGNTEKRNEYSLRWVDKYSEHNNSFSKKYQENNNLSFSIEPAKTALIQYMKNIRSGKLEEAYNILSKYDHKKITLKDFIKWQTLVSEVFELIEFEIGLNAVYNNITINKNKFDICIKMDVRVVEKNYIMGRIEEDLLKKNVVLQDNEWKVFLGYTNLKGMIDKFNKLADLKKIKSSSLYQNKSLQDNLESFCKIAEREQMRYNRYGNIFSIIVIKGLSSYTTIEFEEMLELLLRNLDIVCKLKSDTYIILLPETDKVKARAVFDKIQRAYSLLNKGEIKKYFIEQQENEVLMELLNKCIYK